MRLRQTLELSLGLTLAGAPAVAQSPLAAAQAAANAKPGPRTVPGREIPVPSATVSPESATTIAAPYLPGWNANPSDAAAWKALVQKVADYDNGIQPGIRQRLGVTLTADQIAGVPVFILEPADMPPENRNRVLYNLHGGGYLFGPGESGIAEAAIMAGYGKFRVIAVDYRMPPDAPYPAAMDDAMAVYKGIITTTDPRQVGVFGSSAGGGMTLALMLRAKAEQVPLPAVIAPGAPWSDLTETGDSYKTNEWLDNVIVSYSGFVSAAARLYANGHDLRDPQLSPIHGDFTGLPPAIITTGTRDLFLSNAVLTHRKLRRAGVDAQLQVFEGMSHVSYYIDPFTPESREAFMEIARFMSDRLAR